MRSTIGVPTGVESRLLHVYSLVVFNYTYMHVYLSLMCNKADANALLASSSKMCGNKMLHRVSQAGVGSE